jgi:type II secretory ATPase GspE/PulE/Tfp pilus assembly ATPase PilB-like protein
LINAIIQNSSVANNKKCLKERSELAETSIFNHITKTRNPSQIHAIKNIVEKEAGIFLIQGPPGTGKT